MTVANLKGLELSPELLPELITDSARTSAFQAVTKKMDRLPLEGATQLVVGGRSMAWVAEGARKPESSNISSFKIQPHKMASIFVMTTEFELKAQQVVDEIITRAPSDFAATFDGSISGIVDAPTENFANLGALLGAGETLTDLSDAAAIVGAVATSGGRPTHFVLSETLFWQLRALLTPAGTYVFSGLDASTPNIMGVPVVTFDADGESVGFVGDFANKARWGVAVQPFVRFDRSGTITDSQGVVHNLAQENKLAVFVEGFYGFNVVNTKHFKKIVGTPAV